MSADLNEKVVVAKEALMVALGDYQQKYLNNMKMWFRQKWSKEQFDTESRKLLSGDKIHLHNQFFLAILNKIDALSVSQQPMLSSESYTTTSSGTGSNRQDRKRKRPRSHSERAVFEPCDIYDYLPEENLDFIRPPNSNDDSPAQSIPTQRYCVQELFLPDIRFIMGRLLVGAWDCGLINVEDQVAEYVCLAVQILLKNIISTIILKRKHSRVTSEGSFYYDVGIDLKDPFLRNTAAKQKVDDGPIELDRDITSVNLFRKVNNEDNIFLAGCEELYPPKKHIITLRDVYNAFQDKNTIGSHTVYSLNIERIVQMMH